MRQLCYFKSTDFTGKEFINAIKCTYIQAVQKGGEEVKSSGKVAIGRKEIGDPIRCGLDNQRSQERLLFAFKDCSIRKIIFTKGSNRISKFTFVSD